MANYIGNPYVDDYLQGGTGNDSLKGDTGNDTLIGGRGNDTMTGDADDDVFVYSNGDGNDVITDYEENDKVRIASGTVSTITTSGNDVILTIGSGKITLKDAKDKVITYIEGGVEKRYPDVVQFDGTTAKILEGYTEDSFDTAEYEATGQTVRNIDASEVTHDISITGNKEANSIVGSAENDTIDGAAGKDVLSGGDGDDVIIGGKGNDTMSGGIGADTFVYTLGDGNDVITDYTSSDIISLKSGAVTSAVVNGDDYIFTIGSGSTKGTITVRGAATRYVQIVDRNGNGTWYPDPPPAQWELQKNGKKLTLTEGFVSDSLDVTTETELTNVKDTIVTIDASAAQTDIAITANKRAKSE